MTNDSAFISEIWATVKENVDESQYLDICDKLVELFDSYNISDGFTTEVDFDHPLAIAMKSYFDVGEDEGGYDE